MKNTFDCYFPRVTGVTGVTVSNGAAFRCYTKKKARVTGVTVKPIVRFCYTCYTTKKRRVTATGRAVTGCYTCYTCYTIKTEIETLFSKLYAITLPSEATT